MTWYKQWFGEDYLKVYPHRNEAEARAHIDFVERRLPIKPPQHVLDLGCGSGRHAHELARRGYEVTCLDLSAELLRLARTRLGATHGNPRFVRADMRFIPFPAVFDAVLSFFTTFGYFQREEENLQTLIAIREVLRPDGRFLLDYVNKAHVLHHLVPRDVRRDSGVEIVQERTYNRAAERIEKRIVLKENGRVREYRESVRLYTPAEMRELVDRAELLVEQTFGDFDGSAFSADSPRLILIGRRPSTP